jgi:hypothetical protein
MTDESTMKCEFPASIKIKICETFENAEPSIKSTFRGILIDLRAESWNASDSMRFSRELFSNETDESDWQYEKHDEQRDSIFRGIMIDVIDWSRKEPRPMFATRRLAAREGKKANDGTMTSSDANPMTLANSAATQTLTPAMTTEVLDILRREIEGCLKN